MVFVMQALVVLLVTKAVDCVNSQQLLLRDLFKNYDHDANSEGTENGTLVTFAAKLIRLIELNERSNTIQTQWWIQQTWINKDLSWNKTKYGNVDMVYVTPKRVWTPDVLVYNSAENDDRLSGGTDKYKTQIRISSDGKHTWLAPAMFKSICDVNTRYFPFDDQNCTLQFGSWAFDRSKLDMEINFAESGVNSYKPNTEWELLAFVAWKKLNTYSCCPHPYASVHLEVRLRRRYYYYLVNLVIPCSLIAVMVLLSFVLPPEAGERISLGITVLMAMAIFQELTSGKLPVESTHTPLLAQYYSSAIAEIGLAIFATSVILNFHYRKSKMSNYLRKLIFSILGPLVGINKLNKRKQKPEKLLRRSLKKENGNPGENDPFANCELKSLSLMQRDSSECDTRNEFQSGNKNNSIRETQHLNDSDHHTSGQGHREDRDKKELEEYYSEEWKEAARILDRSTFVVAMIVCVFTFIGIFSQAPRIQENLFGDPEETVEHKLGLSR